MEIWTASACVPERVTPFGLLPGPLFLNKTRGSKSVEVRRTWEACDEFSFSWFHESFWMGFGLRLELVMFLVHGGFGHVLLRSLCSLPFS